MMRKSAEIRTGKVTYERPMPAARIAMSSLVWESRLKRMRAEMRHETGSAIGRM